MNKEKINLKKVELWRQQQTVVRLHNKIYITKRPSNRWNLLSHYSRRSEISLIARVQHIVYYLFSFFYHSSCCLQNVNKFVFRFLWFFTLHRIQTKSFKKLFLLFLNSKNKILSRDSQRSIWRTKIKKRKYSIFRK